MLRLPNRRIDQMLIYLIKLTAVNLKREKPNVKGRQSGSLFSPFAFHTSQ
jgi:hypothetical protein